MLERNVINQMDLAGICTAILPNTGESTFFSAPQEMSSAMDHVLRHEAILHSYKKTELTSSILSDHPGGKLDISNKRKKKAYTLMETEQLSIDWKTDKTEIKDFLELN